MECIQDTCSEWENESPSFDALHSMLCQPTRLLHLFFCFIIVWRGVWREPSKSTIRLWIFLYFNIKAHSEPHFLLSILCLFLIASWSRPLNCFEQTINSGSWGKKVFIMSNESPSACSLWIIVINFKLHVATTASKREEKALGTWTVEDLRVHTQKSDTSVLDDF